MGFLYDEKWGQVNRAMVCSYCQIKGHVHMKNVKRWGSINGGGVLLLATGLPRKNKVTQAHCANCNSTWDF